MTLRVYDPVSRRKRPFVPVRAGQVGIYVCGMTVQDRPHLGHMFAFVACDMIRRYLSHLGYAVTLVQNFTDIDDKIIARAQSENITAAELAERNIAAYHRNAALLGIQPAQHYPRVTQHIPQIIAYIEDLIATGHAYVGLSTANAGPTVEAETATATDVYFAVRSWPDYGQLSGRNPDQLRSDLEAPAQKIHDGQKRDPLDFALWKAARPEEPAWASPWGPGRPGWHIECSALATTYLGEHFDCHGGGQDLLFPHHENELAQSRACSGEDFVNHWLHNGLLYLGDRKMSKSDGNFLAVDDLSERFSGAVLRFYLLSAHFRSRLQYGEDRLEAAAAGHRRLQRGCARLQQALATPPLAVPAGLVSTAGAVLGLAVAEHRRRFFAALDDDFNSGGAIGVLFALLRDLNRYLAEIGGDYLDLSPVTAARDLLVLADSILGLSLALRVEEDGLAAEERGEIPPAVRDQVALREEARRHKDWAQADELRRGIQELGYEVEDTAAGPQLRRHTGPSQ